MLGTETLPGLARPAWRRTATTAGERVTRTIALSRLFGDMPARIGRYRIVGRIGRGGMGSVFDAFDDALQREVAVKVVATADAPQESARRMRREAQALAAISHPNIVEVFAVGTAEDGVFIAMEKIVGQPLQRWLARAEATRSEVLDVFVQVARGLAAAHAQRITHGDVKPSNVIVGDDGRVRVVDFGLAALDDDATGPSRSGSSGIAGTPAYMAPEQLKGARPDAAADQYSFCLMLREALSRRGGGPRWLWRIAARGLATAPHERHASMQAVRAQLERRAPKRWRWVMIGGGLLLLAAAAWVDRPARFAEPTASAHAPHRGAIAVDEALARALERLDADEPEAAIGGLERVYLLALEHNRPDVAFEAAYELVRLEGGPQRNRFPEAFRWGARALAELEREHALGSVRHAKLQRCLGRAHYQQGDFAEARAYHERALPIFEQADGQSLELASTLAALGMAALQLDRADEALPLFKRALAIQEAHHGATHSAVGNALARVALAQRHEGRIAEALATMQRSLAIHEITHPDGSTMTAKLLGEIGSLQWDLGEVDSAIRYTERALHMHRSLSSDEITIARGLANLGIYRRSTGDLDGALEVLAAAATTFEARLGAGHPNVAMAWLSLAESYLEREDPSRALGYVTRAIEALEGSVGAEHSLVGGAYIKLSRAYMQLHRLPEALAAGRRAVAILETLPTPDVKFHVFALNAVCGVQARLRDFTAATAAATAALELLHGHEDDPTFAFAAAGARACLVAARRRRAPA